MFGAVGALMALHHRDRCDGRGQVIDIGLYEALFRFLVPYLPQFALLGKAQQRGGNRFAGAAPRNLYRAAGGEWVAYVEELDAIIQDWMGARPLEEILRALEEAEAVVGPVYDIQRILSDAQYLARGNVLSVDDPDLGEFPMPGIIPRLSRTPGHVAHAGPRLGEHNGAVYCGRLGLSRDDLDRLNHEGVV